MSLPNADAPTITIVVPVRDRPRELRRALDSLLAQTRDDFECIVVDDASAEPLADLVASYDDRFVYVRSDVNLGVIGARFLGLERSRTRYLTLLDSDNEFLPWALERSCQLLDDNPQVDSVAGLYLFPDGLKVRVPRRRATILPSDYAAGGLPASDCLGVVRNVVVQKWLTRRRDYFFLDFALWFTLHVEHSQMFVDEPWARYHTDAVKRATFTHDDRRFRDYVLFVEEMRPRLGTRECKPLDGFLQDAWFRLVRARKWEEARLVGDWLHERGVRTEPVLARETWRRMKRRIAPTRTAEQIV